MDDVRFGRRRFVATSAAALLGGSAGCALAPANEANDAASRESDVMGVYEAVIDSVVLVRVFGVDDPLTGEEGQGQGSAFVFDDGYAVTNHHVVDGGDEFDVRFTTGDWAGASVVGTDRFSDLAVLDVEDLPAAATPLVFAEDEPRVGQVALAIGNPFGLDGSMSEGIVSGVDRSVVGPTEFAIPNAIQTDAPINPGNSGGPLVNLDAAVLGVVNLGGGNLGFAISAALCERVIPALIEDGGFAHSFLGVRLLTVDPVVAEENDLTEVTGVLVVDVLGDGPSADRLRGSDDIVRRYGAEVPVGGDVIVGLDGTRIPDADAFSTYLALETEPEDTLEIEFERDGERETVEVVLDARPNPHVGGSDGAVVR